MTGSKGLHDEVRHGYTMHDLHDLATAAAKYNRGMASDYSDLYETAWHGIVEALLITSHWPTRHDLSTAGRKAIWDSVRSERQAYGYKDRDWYAGLGSAPNFARYWGEGAGENFADRIVDRIACRQITDALDWRDRQILDAVATAGDYGLAGQLLDMKPATVKTYAGLARRRWLALWLDGETLHKIGGYVWRHHDVARQPCGTHAAFRRHKKHKEPMDPQCEAAGLEYEQKDQARRKARKQAALAGASS